MLRKVAILLAALLGGLALTSAQNVSPELISIALDGTAANHNSYAPSLSADGRYVAFYSYASNLVSGDTAGNIPFCPQNCADIFVRDRQTGQTTRVSLTDSGQESNGDSITPAISANGQWVVFQTQATNLLGGAFGGIVLHDIQAGLSYRVDVASNGTGANGFSLNPSINADGRYVTFESGATNLIADDTTATCGGPPTFNLNCFDIFVHDRVTGETTMVSVSSAGEHGNGDSSFASISADGRFVTFTSFSSNIVPNDTNGRADIFVYDRENSQTSRVSVSSSGAQGIPTGGSGGPGGSAYSTISADGRFVVFISSAANLVPGDTNNHNDIFVRDRQTGQTTRESLSSSGVQANGDSNYEEYRPFISDDGRYVTFESLATNLVPGDTNNKEDVFVHDRLTHQTARVSVSAAGEQGSANSYHPVINPDGRFIAFVSAGDELVPGFDNSGNPDIYFDTNPIWTIPPGNASAPTRNYFTSLPLTLTWSAISWAAQYEVLIGIDPKFVVAPYITNPPLPANQLSFTSDALPFPLEDGVYYWKVRAVNRSGVPGAWSAVERFEVDAVP